MKNQQTDALGLAQAHGYCLMRGEETTLPLSREKALLACQEAIWLAKVIDRSLLPSIPDRWDAADDKNDRQQILREPFAWRLALEAAVIALRETYGQEIAEAEAMCNREEYFQAGQYLSEFTYLFDCLVEAVAETDRHMREACILSLISLVTDTELLDQQREYYRNTQIPLPWWLDGYLEMASRRFRVEAKASLPTKEWWVALFGEVPLP